MIAAAEKRAGEKTRRGSVVGSSWIPVVQAVLTHSLHMLIIAVVVVLILHFKSDGQAGNIQGEGKGMCIM